MKELGMRRIIIFLIVSGFLFSGIIQGPVCNIIMPLDLDHDGYSSVLKLNAVAWAKKPGEAKKVKKLEEPKEQGQPGNPIAVPEPSTTAMLGVALLGVTVLVRKKFKK